VTIIRAIRSSVRPKRKDFTTSISRISSLPTGCSHYQKELKAFGFWETQTGTWTQVFRDTGPRDLVPMINYETSEL